MIGGQLLITMALHYALSRCRQHGWLRVCGWLPDSLPSGSAASSSPTSQAADGTPDVHTLDVSELPPSPNDNWLSLSVFEKFTYFGIDRYVRAFSALLVFSFQQMLMVTFRFLKCIDVGDRSVVWGELTHHACMCFTFAVQHGRKWIATAATTAASAYS